MRHGVASASAVGSGVGAVSGWGDYVSRQLFRDILESEEDHVDWLETQLELIGKTGLENYLQSQMHTA